MEKPAHAIPPRVIGHRGALGHAPENTLASLRKAAELGATWVEFDTKLSRDNQPIVFHDDDLERITGVRGPLAEKTLEELQSLDAGAWFANGYSGERIPTLGQALEVLKDHGLGAIVEIKPSPGREVESGRRIARFLKSHWPAALPAPIISSFSLEALAAARTAAPEIPRALNIRHDIPADWRRQLQDAGAIAFHVLERLLDADLAERITAAGYTLRGFTVNQPEVAERLFAWGVGGIFSDFPERFPGHLKSR